MSKKEDAILKLKKYNQDHIIRILQKIDKKDQENLINQILEIDLGQIMDLYEKTKKDKKKTTGKIEPINSLEKSKISKDEINKLSNIGKSSIKEGKYAVVTMAGGQGTRLGFSGPKGTFKLDIGKKGKYIFEILTETLKRAYKEYGFESYWYIMTSEENNDDTIKFFEENNYFGYDKEKVKFFSQGKLPLIDKNGKLLIGKDFKIREASDGNGGVYVALEKNKMIDHMKKNGIERVFICGVDNIMVNMVDPVFLGMTIEKNVPIASKSISKLYPDEKVGVFCIRDKKPGIIEYIELTEEMRNAKNENGKLIYGDANIVSHLLKVDALEEIATKKLDYHAAVKKNAYINENLEEVIPTEPNSYKFESFIFDGFKFLDNMAVLQVKREEEFSPIKNKDGLDSPATAKEIYCKYWNISI